MILDMLIGRCRLWIISRASGNGMGAFENFIGYFVSALLLGGLSVVVYYALAVLWWLANWNGL